MGFLKALGGFVAAVLVLACLATIAQSAFVLIALGSVGAEITFGEGAGMIMQDLTGLAPLYAAFIAIALLVAFLVSAIVARLLPLPRALVFAGAGGVAIAVMLLAMEQVFFGVQLIAGARTMAGFIAQVAAGLFAGLVYALLTPPPRGKLG